MARIKDQAVCIRLIDWSQTSQIVAVLTRGHGVIRGIAKGSKRSSPSSIARFSGGIELLTMGEVMAAVKPSAELANITEWDLQQPWWHFRRDLESQRLGLYAADVVHALLAEHDAHPRTFDALVKFLAALALPAERGVAMLQFQWELLCDAGYQPVLTEDVQTGEPLALRPRYTFDPRRGGLTAEAGAEQWGVRHQTVVALQALAAGDTPAAAGVDRGNRLLCAYIRELLGRELPTMIAVLP